MLPFLIVSRCSLIEDNCINKNRKGIFDKIVKKKGVNNSSRELKMFYEMFNNE